MQNDPHGAEIYELANAVFDFLDEKEASLELLFWFEIHFLGSLGFAPHLAACSRCSRQFETGKPVSFSVADGGLRCAACGHTSHSGGKGASPLSIQPDTLAVLRNWQKSSSPRTAQNTKCSPAQAGEISALLRPFLEFHVAFQGESRNIAVKLLRTRKKRTKTQ
jgi:DNA repair protein RecO